MDIDIVKFRAAHQTWDNARKIFERDIKNVIDGDALARGRLPTLMESHDRAYRDFIKAGEPLWGPRK